MYNKQGFTATVYYNAFESMEHNTFFINFLVAI